MNAQAPGLKHQELTERVIKVYFQVYNELGHGFLESVYLEAMAIALDRGWMPGGKAGEHSSLVSQETNR